MTAFVKSLPLTRDGDRFMLCTVLHDEVKRLRAFLTVVGELDEGTIQAAEAARDDIVNNKSNVFNKAFTVFAAGLSARAACDVYLEKVRKERTHLLTLQDCAVVAPCLPGCTFYISTARSLALPLQIEG
jgi:hypothetical protein